MKVLLLLAGLSLFASISASVVTYSFFWYENAWSARGRGAKLKWMLLSGMLSSIASMTFIMFSYPLGLLRRFWEPGEISADQPVIILAHGLYHNASAWLLFRRRLRKAGFKNIFVMSYGSFFTSFEKTVGKLGKFVADVSQAVPGRPVYLIGHSLGGLLSRVYAERAVSGAIPAAVITMGSPHQGSKLAAFGPGKLASSLLYRGPLFTGLEPGPALVPFAGVAFFSPVDNMVLPSEALRVPYQGWAYYETAPMSHTAMLYSRGVAEKVIEILRDKEIP